MPFMRDICIRRRRMTGHIGYRDRATGITSVRLLVVVTAHGQKISGTIVHVRCSDRPEDDYLTLRTDMRPLGCITTHMPD